MVFVWIGCFLFSHNWETKSFSYGNVEGKARQQIHVYYPDAGMRTGINSCAVYIPGGGWKQHLANWGDEIPLTAHILLSSGLIAAIFPGGVIPPGVTGYITCEKKAGLLLQ